MTPAGSVVRSALGEQGLHIASAVEDAKDSQAGCVEGVDDDDATLEGDEAQVRPYVVPPPTDIGEIGEAGASIPDAANKARARPGSSCAMWS